MKDKSWKAALWDTSWEELYEGRFSEIGICRFSKTEGAVLDIPYGDISKTRVLETTGIYTESIDAKRYDFLYGMTQDGIRLVLCNALSKGVGESSPGSTCETFEAPTVLTSRGEFDPSAPMLSIQFEIGLLRDWLNVKPIRKDNTCAFDYSKGSRSFPLHISTESCMEIRVGIGDPQQIASGMSIPFFCNICIEYPYGKNLDDIWRTDLWKLQSLFAFCFGTYPEIISARARQSRNDRWINIYRSSANAGRATKLPLRPPVPYYQLKRDGLLNLAESWIALSGDEQHAAEMLTSLLGSWSMPLDLQLLAATTMLEALIRADRPSQYDDEELETLGKPIVDAADEEIRERVRSLLSLLKQPSYNQLLKEAYEEGRPWSERLIPRWSKFRKEQNDLRRRGAHGTESNMSPYLRIDHYYGQIALAYFILMKRLGIPTEAINQFEQSTFLNVARRGIAMRYARS